MAKPKRWLRNRSFGAQGIGICPTAKLIRKLGELPADELALFEECDRLLLHRARAPDGG